MLFLARGQRFCFKNKSFPCVSILLNTYPASLATVKFFLLFSLYGLLTSPLIANPKFSIVWSTETRTTSVNLLKDSNFSLLQSGNALNGDGDLVELGYFNEGNSTHPFAGDWIPLSLSTHVGDASSGYGYSDGIFSFRSTFTRDSSLVSHYWGQPKVFHDYLAEPVTSSSPPQGAKVSIRFYDSPNKGGAKYNSVTGANWNWPSFPTGNSIPTTSYFLVSPNSQPPTSIWSYGSTFEDPNNPFMTTIVPSYSINFARSPELEGNGTIVLEGNDTILLEGNRTYSWGNTVNINATPEEHSYFLNWIGSGITDPWDENTTLVVDGDQTVYALFDKMPYFLDLTAKGLGQVTGGGLYAFGDALSISAQPNFGNSFLHWEWFDSGVDWVWSNWDENRSKIGTLIYDLNDSTHLSDLNSSLQTGLYSVLQIESKNYLYPVEFIDTNQSWVIDGGTRIGIDKNQSALKSWLTEKGFAPIDKNHSINFPLQGDTRLVAVFEPNKYDLTVNTEYGMKFAGNVTVLDTLGEKIFEWNSTNWNATTGKIFEHGEVYTIRQNVSGYHYIPMGWDPLTEWNGNANFLETTFTPQNNLSLTAKFKIHSYTLSVESSGGHKSISPTASFPAIFYDENTSSTKPMIIDVEVEIKDGFIFKRWHDPYGILSETNATNTKADLSRNYTYDAKITVNAIIEIQNYDENNIFIDTNFSEGNYSLGSDSSGGYSHFTSYDLNATPAIGYEFVEWEGSSVAQLAFAATEPNNQILIAGDVNLSTSFRPKSFELSLSTNGPGWSEGPDSFTIKDSPIEIKAITFRGYSFSHWSGDIEFLPDPNDANTSIEWNSTSNFPSQHLSLTANFNPEIYSLKVQPQQGGNVDPFLEGNFSIFQDSNGSYEINASSETRIILSSISSTGWSFSRWTSNQEIIDFDPNSSTVIFYPIAESTEEIIYYTAEFSPLEYNSSEVSISSDEGGEIEWNTSQFLALDPDDYIFKHFSRYDLNALPKDGYEFIKWLGDANETQLTHGEKNSTNELLVEGPTNLTAHFKLKEYDRNEIAITWDELRGKVEFQTEANGNFAHFKDYNISAINNPGFKFDIWNVQAPSQSSLLGETNASNNQLNIQGDFAIEATFLPINYEVSLSSSVGGSIVEPLDFNFTVLDIPVIKSIELKGWDFTHWSGDVQFLDQQYKNESLISWINPDDLPNRLNFVANFSPEDYTISIQTNGIGGKINASSAGEIYLEIENLQLSVDSQTSIELNASNNVGWFFSHWSGLPDPTTLEDPNTPISTTSPNLAFIPADHGSYTANFNLIDYNNSQIQINSAANGNIILDSNPSGNYTHFSDYNLSAVPDLGYEFSHWSGDGNLTQLLEGANAAKNVLRVEGPISLTAHFVTSVFNIIYSSEGNGTAQGPVTYTTEETPIITSVPSNGWRFNGWGGDHIAYLVNPQSSESLIQWSSEIPPKNVSFLARFIPEEYTVDIEVSSGGEAVLYQSGISTHSIQNMDSFEIDSQTKVSIQAIPIAGWEFSHWIGLPEESTLWNQDYILDANFKTLTFYPSANLALKANFNLIEYDNSKIILNTNSGGTAHLSSEVSGRFKHFSTYDLIATPQNGYQFDRWDINSSDQVASLLNGLENETNKLTVSGPLSISANFSKIDYFLNVEISGEGNVSSVPTFTVIDSPLLEAYENVGWDFTHWTGDISYLEDNSSHQTTVILNSELPLKDLAYTAHFTREVYPFNVEVVGEGSFDFYKNDKLEISQSSKFNTSVDSNTTVSISVNPKNGWKFVGWLGLPDSSQLLYPASNILPQSQQIEFIPANESNLTAEFVRRKYSLEVNASKPFQGSADGSGVFEFEQTVEINAHPSEHFLFDGWEGDVDHLLYDPAYANNRVLIADKDITLTPIFKPRIYQFNTHNPDGEGNFSVIGKYEGLESINQTNYNATSEIIATAEPKDPYTHMLSEIYWENSKGESGKSYGSKFVLQSLESNFSLWASFTQRRKIKYSMSAVNSSQGNVYENTAASSEQIQNIVASPFKGFSFIGWNSQTGESFSPHWSIHEVSTSLNDNSIISGNFAQNFHFPYSEFNQSMGSVSGMLDSISSGSRLELTAKPKDNYVFTNWELVKEATYSVTQQSSSVIEEENRVFLNNFECPELILIRGFTYHFECNLDDGTEFFLSTQNNISNEYDFVSGVISNRVSQGTLTFSVPNDAPDLLYYNLSDRAYSGNQIKIISLETDKEIIEYPENNIFAADIHYDFGLKANFEPTRHQLSIQPEGNGTVSHALQDIYFWGDAISISAQPDNHWKFTRWSGKDGILDVYSPQTKVLITGDTSLRGHFERIKYFTNLSSSPHEYGNTSTLNGSSFEYQDEILVVAKPKTGKQFDKWIYDKNRLEISDQSDLFKEEASFRVLGDLLHEGDDLNITAQFSRTPMVLNFEVKTINGDNESINETGGEITAVDQVFHGDQITLSFNSFSGFRFLYWEDAVGEVVSWQEKFDFNITKDNDFKVYVEKNKYTFSTSNRGSGEIIYNSENLDDTYEWGDIISLEATPNEHWKFVRWSGPGSEDLNNAQKASTFLTVQKDSNITAEFKKREYTLELLKNHSDFGSTSYLPANNIFYFGDEVFINAQPLLGRKLFENWTFLDNNASFVNGGGTGGQETKVIIKGNTRIQANFKSKEYTINKNIIVLEDGKEVPKFGGRIIGNSTHLDGDDASYEILVTDGYKLLYWMDGDTNETLTTEYIYNRKDLEKNLNLVAVVTNKLYNIEIQNMAPTGGEIKLDGENVENLMSSMYKYGEIIELSANPFPNYRFIKWDIAGASLSNPSQMSQSIAIGNDLKISGYFAPQGNIQLTIDTEPANVAAYIYGAGTHQFSLNHSIITVPKKGYLFSHWVGDDTGIEDINSSSTNILLDRNKSITAKFVIDSNSSDQEDDQNKVYLLSVSANDLSIGETLGSGFFGNGFRQIQAIPNTNSVFSHWEGNNIEDQYSQTTKIYMSQDETVVAHFNKLFDLNVLSSASNQGYTSEGGLFRGWQTIQAYSYEGYEFSHWEGINILDDFNETTQINVLQNTTAIAHFQSVGVFEDSQALEDDWWGSPWFGYYWKFSEDDWLLHEDLGWIYMKKKGDASIWVWVSKMNTWLWTAKEHYPYLYSETSASWFWINLNQSDFSRLVFFDYENDKWVDLK